MPFSDKFHIHGNFFIESSSFWTCITKLWKEIIFFLFTYWFRALTGLQITLFKEQELPVRFTYYH